MQCRSPKEASDLCRYLAEENREGGGKQGMNLGKRKSIRASIKMIVLSQPAAQSIARCVCVCV